MLENPLIQTAPSQRRFCGLRGDLGNWGPHWHSVGRRCDGAVWISGFSSLDGYRLWCTLNHFAVVAQAFVNMRGLVKSKMEGHQYMKLQEIVLQNLRAWNEVAPRFLAISCIDDLPFSVVVFLWGGIYYAIYTLGLVKLGQQFSGADLVAGSAACGATWGIGGLIGTPLAGAAMGQFGSVGFPASMVIAFGVLSIILLLSRKHS